MKNRILYEPLALSLLASTGDSASSARTRVSTGYVRLDGALQGGFLAGSAVVLSAPASDEVPILLRRFLGADSASLLISRNLSSAESIVGDKPDGLKCLICSDKPVPRAQNTLPGKGIENLTELNLTITETINSLQPSRLVVQFLSDVLLRHKALQTRKWLSELLDKFRAKNITTLVLLNPFMHSSEEVQAVVDLFDGNLEIFEKDVEGSPGKFMRVRWMHGITVAETEPIVLDLIPRIKPAPAKKVAHPRNNLPARATPLIGREKELAAAWPLLLRDDVRALSLTGPGGTGKTALGLEIARSLLDSFPDGVFFIQLAPITDLELVMPTVAATLGVREEGGRPIIESLKDFLREHETLLLLDNFEQVIEAASQLADLLTTSAKLKFLVTSREELRIHGEREFPVAPLVVPDLKRLPQIEALSEVGAVALFVERAHAVKPDFEITNENARAVAEICVRLDGLPLALELAAARIKILSPQTILMRLESRLGLLTTGARDAPVRQQTLRNAIAWSYDLLEERDRTVFSRVGVFVGGFTFEAAEAVCNPQRSLTANVLDGLSRLVDRSLLRREEVNGEPRFAFLETLREFALERLLSCGESEAAQRAHLEFFLGLAEKADSELTGPRAGEWLIRLEHEHDNFRAALQWTHQKGEVERELRLSAALFYFWYQQGYLVEGRESLKSALAGSESIRTLERAKVLRGAGVLALDQGDMVEAHSFFEGSLNIFRDLGDKVGVARVLANLALVADTERNYDAAVRLYEESLSLARELRDNMAIARALNNLGIIALSVKGDYDAARSLFGEALALCRELGDRTSSAFCLSNLGAIDLKKGDYGSARTRYEESLTLFREQGNKRLVPFPLLGLGRLAVRRGEYASAFSILTETMAMLQEMGMKEEIAECLEEFAGLASKQGQAERAARIFGAAEALREKVNANLAPAERTENERTYITPARSALGETKFAEAWAEGRSMTMEESITQALEKEK
ncbi:MAG: tetratricopeptide repeat protein [Candidatus Bathyarchaeia archaeon]